MMKKFILIVLLIWSCSEAAAQYSIEIAPHKPKKIEARLIDGSKTTDNYLMNLPLTFSLTDKNVLIIMMGDDASLNYERSVWLFSKDIGFAELQKKDRNVGASKSFKNQNKTLNRFLPYHEKIRLFRPFEDGYEVIKKNVKPILLEITTSSSSSETFLFALQFYVTQPDANYPASFIAKCKPIQIELTIKK